MSSNAPTPPPPSETKLKEALDKMMRLAFEEPEIGRGGHHNFYDTKDFDAAHHDWEAELSAARSFLESLFKELQTENERLKEDAVYAAADLSAAKATLNGWHEIACEHASELSALRSLQLTPEEAQHMLTWGLQTDEVRKASANLLDSTCTSVEGKLRRISSKATSEEL